MSSRPARLHRETRRQTLDWNNSLAVESTCHSCRGPWVQLQPLSGISQQFVTPVLRDPIHSSDHSLLWAIGTHTAYIYVHAEKTFTHLKINELIKKQSLSIFC